MIRVTHGMRRFASVRPLLWAAVVGLAVGIPACGDTGTGPGPTPQPAPTPPPPPPPTPPPPPPPGGSVAVDLDVGEVLVIDDPQALTSITLPAASSAREYRIALQSASDAGNLSMPVKLIGSASSTAANGSVRAAYGFGSPSSTRRSAQEGFGRGIHDLKERHLRQVETVRLQERVWAELRRIGARAAYPGEGRSAADPTLPGIRASSVPSLGDTLSFFLPVVNGFIECNDTSTVSAVVRSIGDHFLIARDTQGPDPVTDEQYAEVQELLDDVIYEINTRYFGETADLDDNDRVIVLVTEEVNKMTEPDDPVIFLGFFLGSDLASQDECPASNVAEIVYIRAPDVDGDFGSETTIEDALEYLRTTTSHEFQHLINAEQRFVLGNQLFGGGEQIWLNEGLSHLAEELVALHLMGHPLRTSLGILNVLEDVDAFNTYLLSNFFNIGATSTDEDGCDGWMVDPENSITIAVTSPTGCATLTMRGWSYLFLRWLGDQFGPAGNGIIPGSNEELLFRELASGGPGHLTGSANVERAVAQFNASVSWEELMADFLVMPTAEGVAGLPPRTQMLTWDLRDLYRGLHENSGTGPLYPKPYPLKVEVNMFASFEDDFVVRTSSARYFTFMANSASPEYTVRITDSAGEPLSVARDPQVTIVRIR